MCKFCWDTLGQPDVFNEGVANAARLIQSVFEFDDGGGYAHGVIKDWNFEDGDIGYCLAIAMADEYGYGEAECKASIECLTALQLLSEEERVSALALSSGFYLPPTEESSS